jgi:hypothetical protein
MNILKFLKLYLNPPIKTTKTNEDDCACSDAPVKNAAKLQKKLIRKALRLAARKLPVDK